MADMGDQGCWCLNGGTCSSSGLCICATGFTGTTCQFNSDPSKSVVSKVFEIAIVVGCIFFFIIVFFWLFKWNKLKRRLENEEIRLISILRYILSPFQLSESRRNSPQSSSVSLSSVLTLCTSPVNRSLDYSSSSLPVLPVTISSFVTAEVKVVKAEHPSNPTHYNNNTTPTESSRLQVEKENMPKLLIPPPDTTCSVVGECKSTPVC